MSRDKNQIKIIGLTGKGNLPAYIAVGILCVLSVWMSSLFPYRSDQYLLFSVPVGIITFLSAVLQIQKPNLYTKYPLQISASALLALISYRSTSYLFPQFYPCIEILTITSFIFVHTLSIWNLPVATLVGDELYAPKTWVGKMVFRAVLVIAPLGFFVGNLLGKASAKNNVGAIVIIGVLSAYLAYSAPFPSLSQHSKRNRPPAGDKLENEKKNQPVKKSTKPQRSTSGRRSSRTKNIKE